MLVRSTSTPILQSLLPSNPSTPTHHHLPSNPSTPTHHHRLSNPSTPTHYHLPTTHHHPPPTNIRRTSSDPNLLNLPCSSTRRPNPVLESTLSFSIHHPGRIEEESDCQDVVSSEKLDVGTANEVVARPLFLARGLGIDHPGRIEEEADCQDVVSSEKLDVGTANEVVARPLFLARGLGIDRVGSFLMNAGEIASAGGDWYGREQSDVEMHYKKLVEEDPSNALYMRNYAQFLYQVKGDLQRAEEYYSRAILAEPGDGQILSQYARLVWELHGDEEWASSYFQQAVQTAPEDSYVHAAHARFLWEAEEDDCADIFHHGALASAAT